MFAAIELGSNSFRLHIGFHDGNEMRLVRSAHDPIRLSAGLDSNGNLTVTTIESALDCLRRFRKILEEHMLDGARVIATSTLRLAKNTAEFLPAAEAAIGYPVEIISGEEEARLLYMGVSCVLGQESRLVIDIGGQFTDVVLGNGLTIRRVDSFSIGTVKQTLSFFSSGRINEESFDAAILSARSHFEDAAAFYEIGACSSAYGTSETIRTISEVISANAVGDGTMSLKSLKVLRSLLCEVRDTRHFSLPGVKQERVAAMAGGLAVLIAAMEVLGIKHITAANAGLRVGVLWDLQLRASERDRREESIRKFVRRFHADHARAIRVAEMASDLYARLDPSTGKYGRHLYWSGLVHEVGVAVSQTNYHKHGAYLVENADLSGFTVREQWLLSRMVLSQKGNLRKIGNALSDSDFAKAVLALRLAIIFMHSRADLNAGGFGLRMQRKIDLELKREWLAQHPTVSCWLQKERECWEEIEVAFLLKIT